MTHTGYISLVSKLGLFAGTDINFFSQEVTFEQMERILANAMCMPVYELKIISQIAGEKLYTGTDENKLLMNTLDIYTQKAMLCATYDVYLNGFTAVGKTDCVLSSTNGSATFRNGMEGIEKYLGINGRYYYKQSKDEEKGTVIYADSFNDCQEITLNYTDISNVTTDRKTVQYRTENSKTREIKIEVDAVFVYNGKRYDAMSREDIFNPRSQVTFIDCDGNDLFDTVFVSHYETMRVDVLSDPIYTWDITSGNYLLNGFELYPEILYEAYENGEGVMRSCTVSDRQTGKVYKLDTKSDEQRLAVYKNGRNAVYADISVGDFLLIYESIDKELVKVVACDRVISGKVTSVSESENYFTINDTEYFYTFDDTNLKPSLIINAYEDQWGNIADYRLNLGSTDLVYGYLMNMSSSGGLAEKIKCRIFTMEQNIIEVDICEKIIWNEEGKKNTDLKVHFQNTGHQLVKYRLNSEGMLKEIYTSVVPQGYVINKEKPVFVMNAHYNDGTDSAVYGEYRTNTLEVEYNVQKAYRLIVITDENGELLEDRVYFTTGFKTGGTPDIRVYDATVGKSAEFLVVTMTLEQAKEYSAIGRSYFLVGKKFDAYDEDEGALKGIRGLGGQYEVDYFETEDVNFDDLNPGDIIAIRWYEQKNGKRYLRSYDKVFSLKNNSYNTTTTMLYGDYDGYTNDNIAVVESIYSKEKIEAGRFCVYGKVESLSSISLEDDIITSRLLLNVRPNGGNVDDVKTIKIAAIGNSRHSPARFNIETNTFERIQPEEITAGSKVFAATYNFEPDFVVVYE